VTHHDPWLIGHGSRFPLVASILKHPLATTRPSRHNVNFQTSLDRSNAHLTSFSTIESTDAYCVLSLTFHRFVIAGIFAQRRPLKLMGHGHILWPMTTVTHDPSWPMTHDQCEPQCRYLCYGALQWLCGHLVNELKRTETLGGAEHLHTM